MKFSLAAFAMAVSVVNADVPSLTPDNYSELTGGKSVFIKFFAPWCGHCKKMAPDWEKLAGDFADNEVGMIAEVDCTTEGKPLCDSNGVKGFPTLKYGDPDALEDYQGGRDYDTLKSFADENLKPSCSPSNIDLCDDDKKAEIETFMALSDADIDSKIAEEEKKLEDAEKEFKDEVQKLQDKYQALNAEKDEKVAAVKASGLGMLKSVKAAKAKAGDAKEEL